MLKRFGITTLALATAMAVAVPTVTFAQGRDDHRGGEVARGNIGRGNVGRGEVFHGRDDHDAHFRGGDRFNVGVGFYAAPAPIAPAASGYYDQFGVWHPYGFYDQFGVWHAY